MPLIYLVAEHTWMIKEMNIFLGLLVPILLLVPRVIKFRWKETCIFPVAAVT